MLFYFVMKMGKTWACFENLPVFLKTSNDYFLGYFQIILILSTKNEHKSSSSFLSMFLLWRHLETSKISRYYPVILARTRLLLVNKGILDRLTKDDILNCMSTEFRINSLALMLFLHIPRSCLVNVLKRISRKILQSRGKPIFGSAWKSAWRTSGFFVYK